MTVYKCDRCGAITEDRPFGFKAGKQDHWALTEDDFIIMDLCPDCYISLMDWAELNKKE